MSNKKKINNMRKLWNLSNKKNKFGFISFLEKKEHWADEEFHWTGIRFAARMMERFKDYGKVEPYYANILEIGCGVGRFLKPLSSFFKRVYGIDISRQMLKTAKEYCSGLPNVTFHLNNGHSLEFLENDSFDYCVSAGVFQHITHIEVIIGYIKEAIRILKPGGVFLFQFEGNRTNRVGYKYTGARITARDLDQGLKDQPFIIREVSSDPDDPIRNVVIVIEKTDSNVHSRDKLQDFQSFKMTDRHWLIGVYNDITTKTTMHSRLQKKENQLTFYNTDLDLLEQLLLDNVNKVGIWGGGLTCELLLEYLKDSSVKVVTIYDSIKKGVLKTYHLKNPYENELSPEIPIIIASSRSIEALSSVVEHLTSKGIIYYHFK